VTGASSSSPSPSGSEDDDKDEDKDGDGDDPVTCGFIRKYLLDRSLFLRFQIEESKEPNNDGDKSWLRLRFLLCLRGAVRLAACC